MLPNVTPAVMLIEPTRKASETHLKCHERLTSDIMRITHTNPSLPPAIELFMVTFIFVQFKEYMLESSLRRRWNTIDTVAAKTCTETDSDYYLH